MPVQFKGRINVGIRDSEPDWTPFEPPGRRTVKAPYHFTGGTISRVAIDVSGDPYMDLEREAALMLMRE